MGDSSPAQTSTPAPGPSYPWIARNAASCISAERLPILQALSLKLPTARGGSGKSTPKLRALTKPGRRKPKQDAEPPPPPSGPTARRAGTAYRSPRSNPDSTPRCLVSLPATGGGKNPTTAALPRARTRRGLRREPGCSGGRNRGQRRPSAAGKRREGGTERGSLRCLPSCGPREGRAGTPRRATAEAVRHHRPGGPAPAPGPQPLPGPPSAGHRGPTAPAAACSAGGCVCVCVGVPRLTVPRRRPASGPAPARPYRRPPEAAPRPRPAKREPARRLLSPPTATSPRSALPSAVSPGRGYLDDPAGQPGHLVSSGLRARGLCLRSGARARPEGVGPALPAAPPLRRGTPGNVGRASVASQCRDRPFGADSRRRLGCKRGSSGPRCRDGRRRGRL